MPSSPALTPALLTPNELCLLEVGVCGMGLFTTLFLGVGDVSVVGLLGVDICVLYELLCVGVGGRTLFRLTRLLAVVGVDGTGTLEAARGVDGASVLLLLLLLCVGVDGVSGLGVLDKGRLPIPMLGVSGVCGAVLRGVCILTVLPTVIPTMLLRFGGGSRRRWWKSALSSSSCWFSSPLTSLSLCTKSSIDIVLDWSSRPMSASLAGLNSGVDCEWLLEVDAPLRADKVSS